MKTTIQEARAVHIEKLTANDRLPVSKAVLTSGKIFPVQNNSDVVEPVLNTERTHTPNVPKHRGPKVMTAEDIKTAAYSGPYAIRQMPKHLQDQLQAIGRSDQQLFDEADHKPTEYTRKGLLARFAAKKLTTKVAVLFSVPVLGTGMMIHNLSSTNDKETTPVILECSKTILDGENPSSIQRSLKDRFGIKPIDTLRAMNNANNVESPNSLVPGSDLHLSAGMCSKIGNAALNKRADTADIHFVGPTIPMPTAPTVAPRL